MGVQPDTSCSRRRVGPCCSHSDSAQVSHGPALQGATVKSTARFQVQAGTVALPLSIPHLTTALPCLPPSGAVHSRITGLYLAFLTRGALWQGQMAGSTKGRGGKYDGCASDAGWLRQRRAAASRCLTGRPLRCADCPALHAALPPLNCLTAHGDTVPLHTHGAWVVVNVIVLDAALGTRLAVSASHVTLQSRRGVHPSSG